MNEPYHLHVYPRRSWRHRLYVVVEAIVFVGGIALIVAVAFWASWTGQ